MALGGSKWGCLDTRAEDRENFGVKEAVFGDHNMQEVLASASACKSLEMEMKEYISSRMVLASLMWD